MKKFILAAFAVPVILTLFTVKANAAVIQKQYDRTYVAQDDSVQVTETKTITVTEPSWYVPAGTEESFIIFNPFQGDPQQSQKIQKTIDSISIKDMNGIALSYSSQTSGSNLLINIRFRNNITYGASYKVTLSYISYGLLIKSGAIRDFYIPAFSKDYVFSDSNSTETVTTQAKIPASFGDINFTAPTVPISKTGDSWTMSFSQDQLIGNTAWIQIGKIQYYSFNIDQPYTPSTSIPLTFNTYKVILPRDIKDGRVAQNVYFTNVDPQPAAVYLDADNNLIAEFRVPSNASGDIKITGYGILDENSQIDPSTSGNLSDVNKIQFQSDLSSAKYWESSALEIQQAANSIKGNETNVYKLVQAAYQFVVSKIDYSTVKRFGTNERLGALETLREGAGVCMEYSDLFIALMRAMGIPARGAFGHGYSAIDYLSTQDNSINHQWAEVYVPGMNTWMPVDTTWGENGPAVIGGDLNHFYSHVASVDPNTPSVTEVSFYGNLSVPDRKDDIEPQAQSYVANLTGLTEAQLLANFPKNNSISEGFSDAVASANLLLNSANNKLDSFLLNAVPQENIRSLLVRAIEILPVAIIVVVVIFVVIRKRRNLKPKLDPQITSIKLNVSEKSPTVQSKTLEG